MEQAKPKDLDRVFREERHLIDDAIEQGVREAAVRHKVSGLPMVVAEDGEIKSVSADEVLAAHVLDDAKTRRRA